MINLAHDPGEVTLSARDDGQGVKMITPGNGLIGMSERLEGLGGGLDIESKPGAGFRLRAWVPAESTT